eukprot:754175-Prymnesium_polylepis.1
MRFSYQTAPAASVVSGVPEFLRGESARGCGWSAARERCMLDAWAGVRCGLWSAGVVLDDDVGRAESARESRRPARACGAGMA